MTLAAWGNPDLDLIDSNADSEYRIPGRSEAAKRVKQPTLFFRQSRTKLCWLLLVRTRNNVVPCGYYGDLDLIC